MEHIKVDNINLEELTRIHLLCDKDFIPALSSRVDIKDYCVKLRNRANLITLNQGTEIIGLVAVYTNDQQKRIAYISSVCILKQYREKGFSKVLLKETIKYSSSIGMQRIHLEVGINNIPAIRLYESLGFNPIEKKTETQIMELILPKE